MLGIEINHQFFEIKAHTYIIISPKTNVNMKKLVVIIFLITVKVGLCYGTEPKYPLNMSDELINFFDKEFVRTINNNALNDDIQKKFFDLFDHVSGVNVQFSDLNGYYYIVFGSKDGVDKIELLKVNEDDVLNETYTYIDFSNVDRTSFGYCKIGNGFPPPVCPLECIHYTDPGTCLGMICGSSPDCIPQK